MGKITAILAIIFFAVSFAYSQNEYADKVNKYCMDIDFKISEEGEYRSYYLLHSIEFESNVRAIGNQRTLIDFYYTQPSDSLVEENGTDYIIDVYKPPVKIEVEYNIAASSRIYIVYYPDEKGNLIYYKYRSMGYENESRKMYFDKGKIAYVDFTKQVPADVNPSEFEVTRIEKNFPKEYIKKGEEVLKKFEEYKDFFFKMIKIEKLDK